MGMYTGLRLKGTLKKEFVNAIELITDNELDWEDLVFEGREYGFIKEFTEKAVRSMMIPNGALSYMPDSWDLYQGENGFNNQVNTESRQWAFQCSLKSGKDIYTFLNLIAVNVLEEASHIEVFYEEWDRSKFYELKDEQIVESNKEGILYGDEYK